MLTALVVDDDNRHRDVVLLLSHEEFGITTATTGVWRDVRYFERSNFVSRAYVAE